MPKRRFGRVRKLPSGRYHARYLDPTGLDRPAPHTFVTKTGANNWLTNVQADIIKGAWRNPDLGRVALGDYLIAWIEQRPGLRPRTVELYRWLYRKYIETPLSAIALKDVTPGLIRAWHAELVGSELKLTMIAKAYRLLHAVLNTAVDDELIARNPCRIRGAGESHTPERPVATIAQVLDIAVRVPARFRALILLAAFTSLRYGELAALCRRDIDADAATVTVRSAMVELATGEIIFGPPKTNAGPRTVTVPTEIRADLRAHLRDYTARTPTALVFTGAKGGQLRRANFQRAVHWATTVRAVGLPGFHVHDLRHTGNSLAADTGASLADLMARIGHGSARAANDLPTRLRQTRPKHCGGTEYRHRAGTHRARSGHETDIRPSR
jgi:integrase